jgi:hypothetical protein
MLPVSLAYKYVAVAVMLAEINYCSNNLHLKQSLPVKDDDIQAVAVFNPKVLGFAGRIDTEYYSFSFVKSGRLRFITKLDAPGRQSYGIYRGTESVHDLMDQLSHVKSTINTNEAYRISTNWLISIDVDLKKLEKGKPLQIEQQFFQSPGRGTMPVPLFYVSWGEQTDPTIDIMISGINGELLNLRQEDDSYSKRPASLIKDMDKLLAIPDQEFLKYSDQEKSNLVVRFSAVSYSQTNVP